MVAENYFENSPGLLETSGIGQFNSVSIGDAIDGLSAENPFAFFDLTMSHEEGDFLQNISVERDFEIQFTVNSDNINEHVVTSVLDSFIKNISEQNKEVSEMATSIIQKEISAILGSDGNALVLMRSALSSSIHQWHTDRSINSVNKVFVEYCKERDSQYSLGWDCKESDVLDTPDKPYGEIISISLKGNKTVFSDVPSSYRAAVSTGLVEVAEFPVAAEALNQGAVFVAHSDYGAVHSHPISHTPRILMLVVLEDEKSLELLNLFQGLEDSFDASLFNNELVTNIDYDKLCQFFNYCTTPSNIRR